MHDEAKWKKIIWIGDINIDQRNIRDLPDRKLDITMKLFGMIQVVTEVTHISYRQGICTESTIDFVMTNCYNNFVNCKVLNCKNVDAAVEGFNEHISEAYEKFCPSTVIKCKSNFLYNPSK